MSLIVIYKSKDYDYICSDSSLSDDSVSCVNLKLHPSTNKLKKISESVFLGFTGNISIQDLIEYKVINVLERHKSIFKNKNKFEEQLRILKTNLIDGFEDEDVSDITIILYLNGHILLLDNGSIFVLDEDVVCFGYPSDFAKGYLTNINLKEKQEKVINVEQEILTLYHYLKENSNYITEPFVIYKVKK
jgi:hypothetical protein